MIVGGYSLDLYCCYSPQARTDMEAKWPVDDAGHARDAFPATFYGPSAADTYAQARARGWRLQLVWGKALCPMCVRLNRRIFQDDRKGWEPHPTAHTNPERIQLPDDGAA